MNSPHSLQKLAEEIAKRTAGNVAEYLGPDLEAQMGIYLAKDIVELARSVRREALEEAAKVSSICRKEIDKRHQFCCGSDIAKAIRELLDKEKP